MNRSFNKYTFFCLNLITHNKRKIINDPVHGFISIPSDIIFDVIEHPYFQRLRRISQLGLTSLVYPGALHTRFHHALGAMHLMGLAIEVLRQKGHEITDEEALSANLAILMHDIGHGSFSHALENSIVHEMNHEVLSELFMHKLNHVFDGKLSMAIEIFKGNYKKRFLHQLVSSQLDVDRLDYMIRDSFFTGVSEGIIGTERLIKMLNVKDDELVVDDKGIYSVEKFIVSRRLMYWQVYLHKTVLSAEHLMVQILKRAEFVAKTNMPLFGTPPLIDFLSNTYKFQDFEKNPTLLDTFSQIDDFDILSGIKTWVNHPDVILSALSKQLIHRKLFRIELQDSPFETVKVDEIKERCSQYFDIQPQDTHYFVFSERVENKIYNPYTDKIKILYKNQKICDISEASDQLGIEVLSKTVTKYFLCYPKELRN